MIRTKEVNLDIAGDNTEIDLSGLTEIQITTNALEKIYSYAEGVDTEVAGLLLVDKKNGIPLIKDALIFDQYASGADVELDINEVTKELMKIHKKDKSQLEFVKGWWHSHVNMDVFWSGTDDDCFENLLSISPLVYGIVVNKHGDTLLRIDMKTDLGVIKFKDITLKTVISLDESCMKEAKLRVKEPNIIEDVERIIKNVSKKVNKYIFPEIKMDKEGWEK